MKTIKIFLASSITQFGIERFELANFIEQMGRRFREEYDVDVVPFICETFDHALTPDGRMQEKFNQELRGSDMVFFLFYTRLGDYTLEEWKTRCNASCRRWSRRSGIIMNRSRALTR